VCRRKSSAQPRLWSRPGASAGRSRNTVSRVV